MQRLCRRDYNQHLNSICHEIENHALHTRDLFLKVRGITRDFRPKTWAIEDEQGNLTTDVDQVTKNGAHTVRVYIRMQIAEYLKWQH